MPRWWLLVRDLVWTSIFTVIFVIVAVFSAFFVPDSIEIVVGSGLAAISLAILSLRQ
jgi:hypothetical protein